MKYLCGRGFREVVVAGADSVRGRREYLNRINVFPVPDGDTGTNMALSLAAAAASVRASESEVLHRVAGQVAEGATLGAKGNSGVILAQWFLSLSEAFAGRERAYVPDLCDALGHATRGVYAAVEAPVEGTILSVMRAVSERASALRDSAETFSALLEQLVDAGERALARTPEQLPALRAAEVVDAGAQGYVDFLAGALRAARGEPAPPVDEDALDGALDHEHSLDEADITERYCTEVVVRGQRLDEARVRETLRGAGSSFLVVTTGTVAKVHVHTNEPDAFLERAATLGEVVERKVDDMVRQAREQAERSIQPLVPLDDQPSHIAIVCDSTADLSAEIRAEHGIEMAPLQVMFGDDVYRDQIDISTDEFYARLASSDVHPSTSQPPPREFVDALDRVRTDREVLVLTLHPKLSGTQRSAEQATRLARHPRVEVATSGDASVAHGLVVRNAARLAARGADMETLLTWVARWREAGRTFIALPTLEYVRRGGRIGRAQALVGGLLGLKPLLTIVAGEVRPLAKARSDKDIEKHARRWLDEHHEPGARLRIGLLHIGEPPLLDRLAEYIESRYEVVERLRTPPSGVVGVHAGPGGWGLVCQQVRDDDPLAPRA